MNIDYFKKIQNMTGHRHIKDAVIDEQKLQIEEEMQESISCDYNAKRNGVNQRFVITSSSVRYKKNIVAFPGEDIFIGDEIEFGGEHWLVVDSKFGNPIQTTALVWLCNKKFRWQNNSSQIIEKWGIFDNGSYSSTKTGDDQIQAKDKQYRIYLPYDDDSQYLYIDKRICKDYMFDKNRNKILDVVVITGQDRISKSYGKNAHLLICECRSGIFSPEQDNLEKEICDYVTSNDSVTPEIENMPIKCSISGRKTIRLKGKQNYTVTFYDKSNNVVDNNDFIWSVEYSNTEIGTHSVNGNNLTLNINSDEKFLGEEIVLQIKNNNGNIMTEMKVEVVF